MCNMQNMPDRPGLLSQSLCSYQIKRDSWSDQEMGSALSLAGNQHSGTAAADCQAQEEHWKVGKRVRVTAERLGLGWMCSHCSPL